MEQNYVYDLHTEQQEWLNKAEFYRDEIKILRHRLTETAAKNTVKELQIDIEHFENQLTVQQEQLDILRHDIKQYENKIERSISMNPTAADHRKADEPVELRSSVETFEKIFAELRHEMNLFFSKWM